MLNRNRVNRVFFNSNNNARQQLLACLKRQHLRLSICASSLWYITRCVRHSALCVACAWKKDAPWHLAKPESRADNDGSAFGSAIANCFRAAAVHRWVERLSVRSVSWSTGSDYRLCICKWHEFPSPQCGCRGTLMRITRRVLLGILGKKLDPDQAKPSSSNCWLWV